METTPSLPPICAVNKELEDWSQVLDQVDAYAIIDELEVTKRATFRAFPQHFWTHATSQGIHTRDKQGVHRESSRSRVPVFFEIRSRPVATELTPDIPREADQIEVEVVVRDVVAPSVAVYRFRQVQTNLRKCPVPLRADVIALVCRRE